MSFDKLVPCISLHDETKGLFRVLADRNDREFNRTNLYDLNDALIGNITLASQNAVLNSKELRVLRMQALVIHRDTDGNLHMMLSSREPEDFRPWLSRWKPAVASFYDDNLPLHAMLEQFLANSLFDMGVLTSDTPTGMPVPVPVDTIRMECDLTVAGFHTQVKFSGREFVVSSVVNVRKNLYDYMCAKGYRWVPCDQHMQPTTDMKFETREELELFLAEVKKHTYDNVITINPGLE